MKSEIQPRLTTSNQLIFNGLHTKEVEVEYTFCHDMYRSKLLCNMGDIRRVEERNTYDLKVFFRIACLSCSRYIILLRQSTSLTMPFLGIYTQSSITNLISMLASICIRQSQNGAIVDKYFTTDTSLYV